ncbi:MAG: hypothetical protein HC853_04625 [Anaerolineae bacterium]|nr:hypothetical protein [Anaerolineae bacterium]
MLSLNDVLEALTGRRVDALASSYVTRFSIDSREVARGELFVAFRGERTDGHKYVGHAFGRGAVAALVEDELDLEVTQSTQAVTIDVRNWVGRSIAAPLRGRSSARHPRRFNRSRVAKDCDVLAQQVPQTAGDWGDGQHRQDLD